MKLPLTQSFSIEQYPHHYYSGLFTPGDRDAISKFQADFVFAAGLTGIKDFRISLDKDNNPELRARKDRVVLHLTREEDIELVDAALAEIAPVVATETTYTPSPAAHNYLPTPGRNPNRPALVSA